DTQLGDTGTLDGWSLTFKTGLLNVIANGNSMDQNQDGLTAENPEFVRFVGTSPGDIYAVPTPAPLTRTVFKNNPQDPVDGDGQHHFYPRPPFDQTTLPLIIPGPYVLRIHTQQLSDTFAAPADQVNIPVPPAPSTGGTGNPAKDITVSQINVTSYAFTAIITKVTVNVNIQHPRVG